MIHSEIFDKCVEKRYQIELARIVSKQIVPGRETDKVDFWSLTFKQAYFLQQKIYRANPGIIGPLDLHNPSMKRLLLLYLSTRHSCIDFDIARKRDRFAAIRCAFLIRCLKKPGQKLQARKSLDVWLARCGFASTHIRYIVLPHYAFKTYCQKFLVHTLRSLDVDPLE